MASMGTEAVEVAVIGAGPSGAMTALHLAGRGVDVVLIDKRPFPRDKACGDALIPDAQNALARAGLLDTVIEAGFVVRKGVVFSPRRIQVEVGGRFVTMPRERFDKLVLDAALARGAQLRTDKVTSMEMDGRGVTLTLSEAGSMRARYVIVATGANIALLEQLGAVDDPRPTAYAFRQYFRSEKPLDRLVISYDRTILPGYAWVFPVGEHELNIGLGVEHGRTLKPRQALAEFMGEFPLLRDELGELTPISRLRGANLRCGLRGTRPVTGGRVLAVGDAIGATFPFTGEGIGKALETGEIAADVLGTALEAGDGDRLSEYAVRIDQLRAKYLGYQIAERWLSHAWVADLVLGRVKRSRTLKRQLTDLVNETVDPRRIFSAAGLLRSLFG
jgi:geranylgeranyl reductase family protein